MNMMTPIILTYLGFSVLVALFASGRRISFAGAFFTSILMSPLVGILAILKSEKNMLIKHYATRYVCPKCNFEYTEEKEHCDFCNEMGKTIKLESVRILIQE